MPSRPPPPASKSRLSGSERRQQIIAKASTLFAEHGFAGVTVKKLADACGINQAMLYHHFASKEDLYLAVVEEKIRQLDTETPHRGSNSQNDSLLPGLEAAVQLHRLPSHGGIGFETGILRAIHKDWVPSL